MSEHGISIPHYPSFILKKKNLVPLSFVEFSGWKWIWLLSETNIFNYILEKDIYYKAKIQGFRECVGTIGSGYARTGMSNQVFLCLFAFYNNFCQVLWSQTVLWWIIWDS